MSDLGLRSPTGGRDWVNDMDPFRLHTNIRRTVQSQIGNLVTADGDDYPVYHDWSWADPDDARDGSSADGDVAWVETVFVFEGAGRRSFSLLQADIFSRIGEPGGAEGDPFGMRVGAIADSLESIFSGLRPDGAMRAFFDIQDFADPAAPLDTGVCMVCQNSDGSFGMAEERKRTPVENSLRRVTLTWRFRLKQDAAGQSAFYTD